MFSKLFSFLPGGNMITFLAIAALAILAIVGAFYAQNVQINRYKANIGELRAENIRTAIAYAQVLQESKQLAQQRQVDSEVISELTKKLSKNQGAVDESRKAQKKLEIASPKTSDYLSSPIEPELARLLDAEDARTIDEL